MSSQQAMLLFFFLFKSLLSFSQQHNYTFKNIDINDGLSQNSVIDIVEDPSGFIWFATQDGLNRYDGMNFLIFHIPFDDITTPDNAQLGKLLVNQNKIWMIKRGGKIMTLDLYTHKLESVNFFKNGNERLPPASFIHIDKKNQFWIGTLESGIYHFDTQENFIKFSEDSPHSTKIISNKVRSIFEDSENNIWVLTHFGLTRLSSQIPEDYLSSINSNVITEAPDKSLWLGTLGSGIFIKKHGSDKFLPFNGYGIQKISSSLVVETIHADSEDNIWVGTYGDGLYIINTCDEKITHLLPDRQDPMALTFQDILSIKEDHKKGIWIGTDGGGVSYYNRQFNNFKTIALHKVDANISIEQIRAIVTDKQDNIWWGTSGQGLTCYDPHTGIFETFHLKPFKDGVSNYDRIVSLAIDREGDLWIGTQGNGLIVMNRKTKQIKKWFTTEAKKENERIPDNTIWSMLEGEKGSMWAATRKAGLLLIDKEKGIVKNYIVPVTKEGEAEGINIQSLIQIDSSTLVMGVERRAVQFLDIPTGRFSSLKNSLSNKMAREETYIKSLYFRNNWLWIGTAGKGIITTNLITGKTLSLNEQNWLPNDMVYSILPDNQGNLWMSSNKGVFRLTYKPGNTSIKVEQVYPFTVADGLQSNEFNTGAFHRSEDGKLYFGGVRGLTYFNPHELNFKPEDLSVVLTGAMIDNKRMSGDTVITYKDGLKLPYLQNSLSFDFTVLDFVSPENLQFQYQLEGYDKGWIDAGNRNYTAYTNLPPDDYIFKVKVSDKISAEAPYTSFFISIDAPFWQSWWFIYLTISVIMAIIYGLHRYRIYQLIQVQKVKDLISADLHDDLGSRLTNIQFLTALSKNKIDTGSREALYLDGIGQEVEASAKALDEIVWNIKMKDESLEQVLAKMRKYAGEVLENNYKYQVNIQGDFTKKRMTMQKRRELFLVFKELLNNIRKHAEATKVRVMIKIEKGMFFLAVEDDGCGFDLKNDSQRNGLQNIKQRVKKWKGHIKLKSKKNKGTRVSLQIPFDSNWFSVPTNITKFWEGQFQNLKN